MVILRARVKCLECDKSVGKTDTLLVRTLAGEKRYKCYSCYQRKSNKHWSIKTGVQEKQDYYCERCRFKFKSRTPVCTYCSMEDRVVRGEFQLKDFI